MQGNTPLKKQLEELEVEDFIIIVSSKKLIINEIQR